MFQTKLVDKIKAFMLSNFFFPKIVPFLDEEEDDDDNSNNNNHNYYYYLLQLGCHPVAVVILHVYKI